MNGLFSSVLNMTLLALDAQQAAQLRLLRLGEGGASAIDESVLMVQEKIEAAGEAARLVMAGGSLDSVVSSYRTIVEANIQRLRQAG